LGELPAYVATTEAREGTEATDQGGGATDGPADDAVALGLGVWLGVGVEVALGLGVGVAVVASAAVVGVSGRVAVEQPARAHSPAATTRRRPGVARSVTRPPPSATPATVVARAALTLQE
jgi:hypothetical protein